MAADSPETFNQRLSQWVASQGFWFQVRYSMASGGSRGVLLAQILRMVLRVFVFVLVLAIAATVYLVWLPGTKGFQSRLEESINTGLGATKSKMGGFQRIQGEMMMRRFASEGGSQTFFSELEAKGIKARMGFFDALPGSWRLGVLTISDLDIQLNAGADDEGASKKIGNVLFQSFENLEFETIDVTRGNIRWGFSERSRGSVLGSHVRFHRTGHGWRIQASGGQFSQGWLKRLDIVELTLVCTRDEIVFEKAEFRSGPGSVRMDGMKISTGARPELKGTIRANRLPIEGLIPPATREFVEGRISGEFKVSGSTNTNEGIAIEGKVLVDEDNPIVLRDRIYLLRALSEFAVFTNFKSVEFKQGSFRIKTQGGAMDVSEVDLKAGDLLTMAGQMKVRLPTREEAAAAVQRNRVGDRIEPSPSVPNQGGGGGSGLSLKQAAKELQKEREKNLGANIDDEGAEFFDRVGQSFQARLLADQAIEIESRTYMYVGGFQITLPPETFENTPTLRELFPVDPQSGRIPMDVPLKGDLYSLTFDQTEELYLKGKKY
ncbi:MAG: hypothetical protein J0M04_21590 [Verrucomicrobia bacterium]|nr:hypothetical protein [Verrucomicrobiota bacterium]